MEEKQIVFNATKKYLVKGNTKNPKAILFIFHGYGQLVKFFSKKFSVLEREYKLIFPEALSKFYLGYDFKKVCASWLTKVDKEIEIENNLVYLDKIWENENQEGLAVKVIAFSQGVSMASRWLAKQKISFNQLVLWGGKFPLDINEKAFNYLNENETSVDLVAGDKDFLIDNKQIEVQIEVLRTYFNASNINEHVFSGGHEIDEALLVKLFN